MFERITNSVRFRARRAAERWWLWPTPNWRWHGYAELVTGGTHFRFYDPGLRCCHEVRRGEYEPGVSECLERIVRPGDTVLDIGAHMGLYTVLAAKLTGPGGAVWAFEPDPVSRRILTQNMRLNGLDNVSIIPMAMSAGSGRAPLSATEFGRSGSTIGHLPNPGPDEVRTIAVRTTTLDAFASERGISPDVAKIDVEGAEDLVLAGGTRTLGRMRAVILELHPEKLHASFGTTADSVLARVRRLGFRVWEAERPDRELDPSRPFQTTTRLLLLRAPLGCP